MTPPPSISPWNSTPIGGNIGVGGEMGTMGAIPAWGMGNAFCYGGGTDYWTTSTASTPDSSTPPTDTEDPAHHIVGPHASSVGLPHGSGESVSGDFIHGSGSVSGSLVDGSGSESGILDDSGIESENIVDGSGGLPLKDNQFPAPSLVLRGSEGFIDLRKSFFLRNTCLICHVDLQNNTVKAIHCHKHIAQNHEVFIFSFIFLCFDLIVIDRVFITNISPDG
jgi:hypothetical protein